MVMASLFLPWLARAHTPGLSAAELDVGLDGAVDARLTFATAEPLGRTTLSQEDLRAFVLEGVDVSADGARCPATYRGSALTEVDGLLLQATYACPPDASEVAVTLYYLSALPPGHREIARIEGPPGSGAHAEAVLSADHRALVLKMPESDESVRRVGKARLRARIAAVATLGVLALSFSIWWRRARRKRSG
jgi:hypothetical protein